MEQSMRLPSLLVGCEKFSGFWKRRPRAPKLGRVVRCFFSLFRYCEPVQEVGPGHPPRHLESGLRSLASSPHYFGWGLLAWTL